MPLPGPYFRPSDEVLAEIIQRLTVVEKSADQTFVLIVCTMVLTLITLILSIVLVLRAA